MGSTQTRVFCTWLRRQGEFIPSIPNQMLHDYLSKDQLSGENIFDVTFVEKLINDHEQGLKILFVDTVDVVNVERI